MINLNFTDSNSTTDQNISLDNIFLSSNNPRYKSWLLDDDIIELIIDDSVNLEEKTIEKLLNNEGDFSDLLDLLNSINNEAYLSSEMDPIILLSSDNNFIVAEGNRRIMVLKFIQKKYKIPDYKKILRGQEYSDDSLLNNEAEEDSKEIVFAKKAEENYKKIQPIIKDIREKHKGESWKIFYKIISDKTDLTKIIYQKHLAGERLGMKKWPRTKYYVDLLINFPKGIDVVANKSMLANFRRKESSIINDFKQAQFIYSCVYTKQNPSEKNINFNDEEILSQMSNNFQDISGLETNHSYNKVRNGIIDLERINNEEFKKNYFDVQWPKDKNYRIEFKETEKITRERILKFIYDKWKQKILNTRQIKDKDAFLDSIRNDLLKYPDIHLEMPLTEDEINSMNEFDFNIDDLTKIIKLNKSIHEKNIKRFEFALEIQKNFNEFKGLWLPLDINNNPLLVFGILINQYKSTKLVYINSLASTIRTFFEQFLIWISHIAKYEIGINIATIKDESTDSKKDRNDCHNIAYGVKMQQRYKRASEYFFGNENNGPRGHWDDFIKTLEYVYKKESQKNINKHKDFILKNKKEINDVLNDFIHASHKIYLNDEYILNLKKILHWQKFIYDVFDSINIKKFKKTSDYVSLNSKSNE